MTKSITRFCLMVIFGLLICGVSYSEPLYDIVEVDLSRPVDIGPTVLQPGHYRFEQVNGKSDPSIFKVTGDQGEVATLTSVGFDAYKQPGPAKETKLVLTKVGDKYYLDQIWIQGQSQGYEFPHTNVSRAELRGGAQENVAGKWSRNDSSSTQSASTPESGNQDSSTMNSSSGSATTSSSPSSASTNQGSSSTAGSGTMNNQSSGATAQHSTSDTSVQSSHTSASAGNSGSTTASNAQSYVGCVVSPVGGSYELDVSGKRYALRGDYDNVRESVGRIVSIWGVTEQSGTATAEPLALAVQRVTPQSEMCDATTGARLNSSDSNTTASSQSTGGTTAATTGSTSTMNSSPSSDSSGSSIGSQASTPSSTTQSSAMGDSSASGVNSVTGCLESSGADTYSIKAAETGSQTTVVPDARISSELSNHVGHQVRLVGNWSDNQMPSSNTNNSATVSSSSSSASSMSSGSQQFRVERIDVISLSCAAQ